MEGPASSRRGLIEIACGAVFNPASEPRRGSREGRESPQIRRGGRARKLRAKPALLFASPA
jgi:hypothetical protein